MQNPTFNNKVLGMTLFAGALALAIMAPVHAQVLGGRGSLAGPLVVRTIVDRATVRSRQAISPVATSIRSVRESNSLSITFVPSGANSA